MSHGCHTCHSPNGCHCLELREYEAAKAALDPEIAELLMEAQKVDAEIGAKRQSFAAKAARLATLIREKPAESDAFLLASVKIRLLKKSKSTAQTMAWRPLLQALRALAGSRFGGDDSAVDGNTWVRCGGDFVPSEIGHL